MKWIFLWVLFVPCLSTKGQQGPPILPFKKFPTLPPLELTQPNNTLLTSTDLKKQPTLIMYFSPTCDHCIKQIKEMQEQISAFKKIQVVMATYQPMEELEAFIKEYELGKYSNFVLGRDSKFILPPFYKIKSMPFFALYNKKGELITSFEGNIPVEKILNAFSQK